MVGLFLVNAEFRCFPPHLFDIVCLLPVVIRNIRASGSSTNLARASVQNLVVTELRRILDIPPQRFRTQSAIMLVPPADRKAVTAEEIVCLCGKLQQLHSETLVDLVRVFIRVLGEPDHKTDRHTPVPLHRAASDLTLTMAPASGSCCSFMDFPGGCGSEQISESAQIVSI